MPKAPNQPIHPVIDQLSKSNRKLFASLSAQIRKRTNVSGSNVDKAVDDAVKALGMVEILKRQTVDSAIGLIENGIGVNNLVDADGVRRFWLNNLWSGDDLTLSKRINDLGRMKEIKSAIKIGFRDKRSWTGTARELSKRNLTKADLAKHVDILLAKSRRLYSGDLTAFREYEVALNKSMRQVDRLARNGAPTTRLKKAYQGVIRTVDSNSTRSLDKAMDRLVKAKMQFNADRIARTEMAKAYSQGVYQDVINDPDIKAIRYELSSRHIITDICDFHTGADMFNMGKGVYPLRNLPPYPFHPQCTCVMSDVFEGNPRPIKTSNGAKFIRSRSKKEQKMMLGVKGAKQFNRSSRSWKDNLRGFDGYRTIDTLREKKGLK